VNVGFVVSFLLAISCFFHPGHCEPQVAGKQEGKVKITVVVILANDRCTVVDPRLKSIADQAVLLEPKLTGFSLFSMTNATVAAGQKATFTCVEKDQVEVTCCHCVDEANKVCLKVNLPHGEEVKYTVVCGKFLPFMTKCQPKEFIPPARAAKALTHLLSGMQFGPVRTVEILRDIKCQPRVMVAICVEPWPGK
jgi:hypothetical protein